MFSYDPSKDDDRLISLGLSVRAYNYCQRNKIFTVSGLIDYFKINEFSIPYGANAGKTTVEELSRVCRELISSDNTCEIDDGDLDTIKLWGVSTRAYNYCQSLRLTSKNSLLKYYLSNNSSIPPIANVGFKTINELETFCKKLIQANPLIVDSCGYEKKETREPATVDSLSLSKEDTEYVSSFMLSHNHMPILWLLGRYIENNMDAMCFSYAYGIDDNKGIKTVSELSKEYNVTQSRIGQRVNNGYQILFSSNTSNSTLRKFHDVFNRNSVQYLIDAIGECDVLCSLDPISRIKDLCRSEQSGFSAAFVMRFISCYTDQFTRIGDFERNNTNTEVILINKSISSVFDFENFCNQFDTLLNNLSENTTLNLREYVEDSSCWLQYSISFSDKVLKACKSIVLSRFNLYDEEGDDILHISPKNVDLGSVVYNIISSSETPLTIEEIVRKIENEYTPGMFSESQIRLVLREDKRIQFKRDGGGKTKYLLASDDIPSSVRDAIVRILEQSQNPITLDEIVDFVLLHFPSSSKNSVRTTMLNDGRSRFIQFTDGLFGLASKVYPSEYSIAADTSRASYEERIIELKKYVNETHQFPLVDSSDSGEVSLARWMERNSGKPEVKELIDKYNLIVWEETCTKCETFIRSHGGKLPNKDRDSYLYKWILNAAADFKEGRLNQTQRKLYLHLTMTIKNRHA